MSIPRGLRAPTLIVCMALAASLRAEVPVLELAEAERLALEHDVSAAGLEARARALREAAVAAGQLPDPRVKLGLMNLPTDSFSRSQEAMTQLQVGVQQAFPPGRTLALREARTRVLSEASAARAADQRLRVQRDLRLAWLDVWYQVAAGRIVDESRELFRQLLEVTRAHYAAGRRNQQDVLRASVELGLLDDRRTRIRTAEETARAALARLIGPQAARDLPAMLPVFSPPPPLAELRARLDEHPLLIAAGRRVEAGELDTDIARQKYKPGWMVDVTYGDRVGNNPNGSDRADFLSAMVSLDVPLFTGKRQDRVLAARREALAAERLSREDLLRDLTRRLEAVWAEWQRLDERVQLYDRKVVPEAIQNAEASLTAYQNDVTDFTGLMRARLTELDSRLMALKLRVDRARAAVRLLYLKGERS
ncbi:TolC family protein [Thiohalobacter sp.]|uniref:TolC family protein n=1 Tax=Thiohalobacter sp. TaxID=2025948 RepID=UPI0026389344|nr:TolC family protein [Thiohalobacter sp.]